MTTRKQQNQEQAEQSRAPYLVGAEAALRRAVDRSRRRAMESIGAVAAFRDGKVVWERADGTFTDDLEGVHRPGAQGAA